MSCSRKSASIKFVAACSDAWCLPCGVIIIANVQMNAKQKTCKKIGWTKKWLISTLTIRSESIDYSLFVARRIREKMPDFDEPRIAKKMETCWKYSIRRWDYEHKLSASEDFKRICYRTRFELTIKEVVDWLEMVFVLVNNFILIAIIIIVISCVRLGSGSANR